MGTAVGAAVGAAVGLAVGAAVGAAVGFAVGAGVGLAALPEGLLLEVWELLGFAVAAGFGVGLTVLLLSAFDAEDVLLVLLAAELSVSVFSATLFPVHPAKDAMSTAAIRIAVSFFFM